MKQGLLIMLILTTLKKMMTSKYIIIEKLYYPLLVIMFFFGGCKKDTAVYKDLSVTVWYETKPLTTVLKIPDVGAKCYVFKNFNIHENTFTTNLNGTIKLSNGTTLNPDETFIYEGGVHYVSNIKVGTYVTVMVISNHSPSLSHTVTQLIKEDDVITPFNNIDVIFGLYDMPNN
jgi:hypothetical protein